MPIYDYLCPDGHRFEVVQRFSDEPVAVCEVCGKPVQRVLHAPAVHTGDDLASTQYAEALAALPAMPVVLADLGVGESPAGVASALEFVLEGLHLTKRLNKDAVGGRAAYRARG